MATKKFIVVPDSFKGTMRSEEICGIVSRGILAHFPDADVISLPVADGGEGSVDAFLEAVPGEKVFLPVKGPYMEDMEGFYGLIDGGRTAVIEMAACAGLPLVLDNRNPAKTTTYGVGQLIADAIRRGCETVIVGLGGSATNDMGTGAAAAMGVRFLDSEGNEFLPVGGTLSRIARIDRSGLPEKLPRILAMCDIDNPLYGEMGAAHVFGPQKGADAEAVRFLDGELRAASDTVREQLSIDVSALPGAGAAGGMGAGMVAFFGARLMMGIEVVLDTVGFDAMLGGADYVITGEGKIDSQSLRGKVVIGVARRAKRHGVPVVALVGDIGDDIEGIYDEGVTAVFSINRVAVGFEIAKARCRQDMAGAVDSLMRLLKAEKGT